MNLKKITNIIEMIGLGIIVAFITFALLWIISQIRDQYILRGGFTNSNSRYVSYLSSSDGGSGPFSPGPYQPGPQPTPIGG